MTSSVPGEGKTPYVDVTAIHPTLAQAALVWSCARAMTHHHHRRRDGAKVADPLAWAIAPRRRWWAASAQMRTADRVRTRPPSQLWTRHVPSQTHVPTVPEAIHDMDRLMRGILNDHGRPASPPGVRKPGDEVVVPPSGLTGKIAAIDLFDREIRSLHADVCHDAPRERRRREPRRHDRQGQERADAQPGHRSDALLDD